MEEEIKDIQNSLWKIYKNFLDDHDVQNYTRKAAAIARKYEGNRQMHSFCQNLVITWAPVINELKRKYAGEKKAC